MAARLAPRLPPAMYRTCCTSGPGDISRLGPDCMRQLRPLSTTSMRLYPKPNKSSYMPKMRAGKAERSMRVVMAEAVRDGKLPTDRGLIPGTFIMPTDRPSWTSMPRERLRLERKRFLERAKDLFTIARYKFLAKPRPKLHLRQTPRLAKDLYEKMYTAFAEGDLATLRKLCANGLAESFAQRLAARPAGTAYAWRLHRYVGRARVVSHRSAEFRERPGNALRQAVVRIRSRQSLRKTVGGRPADEVGKGGEEGEEKTEYFVVQRLMVNGVEGEWMVWGTVQESDWKSVVFES